jgi:hypothetical protein
VYRIADAEGNVLGELNCITEDQGKRLRKHFPEWTINRYLSMKDPDVGTRIEWIAFKLGTGPEPGTDEWCDELASHLGTTDRGRAFHYLVHTRLMTYQQIADRYGISRSRVNQLIHKSQEA